jgi:phosphoglycolate phosphatase
VYRHVAFDLDGTLIDSRADIAAAVNHVLRSFDLAEIDVATVSHYVGEGARVLVERALGPGRQALVERGFERFVAYYDRHLLDATRPYPGIPEALAALAGDGIVLSVLTNKPVAMTRAILDGLDLAPRFVAVLGGDSLPVRKPDPAGLAELCALTATPPEQMLLVGDSEIDVRTARAASVAFCGVTWGFGSEAVRAADAAHLIDHPEELVALVRS